MLLNVFTTSNINVLLKWLLYIMIIMFILWLSLFLLTIRFRLFSLIRNTIKYYKYVSNISDVAKEDHLFPLVQDIPYLLWGISTAWCRCLPDILIIGTAKAGTTSMMTYLSEHPCIYTGCIKETHIFDNRSVLGGDFYDMLHIVWPGFLHFIIK